MNLQFQQLFPGNSSDSVSHIQLQYRRLLFKSIFLPTIHNMNHLKFCPSAGHKLKSLCYSNLLSPQLLVNLNLILCLWLFGLFSCVMFPHNYSQIFITYLSFSCQFLRALLGYKYQLLFICFRNNFQIYHLPVNLLMFSM